MANQTSGQERPAPAATFHFPAGFLWGAATAAHQVEGGNKNNTWSAWEEQPGRIHNGEKAGLACDWWGGRWREDFDRAADSGQNAHRLSLEWSRIQPGPDFWDEDALERYRAILRGLRDRNMTACVTLHHFSDPLWVAERGGWENAETPALFARFVEKTVEALKEYCTLWVTINEPNVFTFNGWLLGAFPPGKRDLKAVGRVYVNLLKAHALAYHAIHRIQPHARVGIAQHYRAERPAGPLVFMDQIPAGIIHRAFNTSFIDALVDGKLRLPTINAAVPEAKGTQDFIGVNYYTVEMVRLNLFKPGDLFSDRFYQPGTPLSETGFIAHAPDGMREALKWVKRYRLPIIVSENGVEDPNDRLRPRYLLEHLHQVWRAINYNYPVKGYFHWSLVDNFEWERGWSQRFGLWGLDTTTQMRIRRPSVDLYADICRQNAISREMVEKYAPESVPVLFPG
jgi:beta-glucosidase